MRLSRALGSACRLLVVVAALALHAAAAGGAARRAGAGRGGQGGALLLAARRRAVRAARAVQALQVVDTPGRSGAGRHEEGTLVATSAEPQPSSDTPTTLTLTNSSVQHVGSSDNSGVPARKRALPAEADIRAVHIEASKVRRRKPTIGSCRRSPW